MAAKEAVFSFLFLVTSCMFQDPNIIIACSAAPECCRLCRRSSQAEI